MSREKGYIDRGDLVKIVYVESGGCAVGASTGDKKYLGRIGLVIDNNGVGNCDVKFSDGEVAAFWNNRDLKYATKKERDSFLGELLEMFKSGE